MRRERMRARIAERAALIVPPAPAAADVPPSHRTRDGHVSSIDAPAKSLQC
jgi:hypothetical protein